MAKLSKAEQKKQAKVAAVRRESAGRAIAERQAIRLELNKPGEPGFGTSPNSMGAVKLASEEARLISCPDCGYSDGRHSRMCARA